MVQDCYAAQGQHVQAVVVVLHRRRRKAACSTENCGATGHHYKPSIDICDIVK